MVAPLPPSRQVAGKSYDERKVCALFGRASRNIYLVDLIVATIDFLRHILHVRATACISLRIGISLK